MPSVTVYGKTIHYRDEGTGFPLIFGHSYLWNAAMWEPQIQALSRHYRCIVPELWGHGGSDNLQERHSYPVLSLAQDYIALMEALRLPKVALIGLSVGAMWAVDLALLHPEKIAALVLMDSYVGEEPATTKASYMGMIDMVQQAGSFPEPIIEKLIPLFFSPYTIREKTALVAKFTALLKSYQPEQIKTIAAIGRGIFSRPSKLVQLPLLTMPALVMVGEDDKPRPVSEAKSMAEALPAAEFICIPEAGHISNLEQPDTVSEALRAFLGRLPLRPSHIGQSLTFVE